MGFDYSANVTAIKNALETCNTSTSTPDLSEGLTSRVKNVFISDPEIVSVKSVLYPAVYVRISSKQEEFSSIGGTGVTNGAKKFADVTYDIFGLYQKNGAYTDYANVLTEIYNFGRNIEAVFQSELTLSGTALWCNPVKTDYLGPFPGDGVWVKGVRVELKARYLFL